MISTKCPYCGGRGWAWVGVGGNADREPCDECQGTGRTGIQWVSIGGVALVVVSAIFSLALILWSSHMAFGAEVPQYAEERTLAWFRTLPEGTKTALVVGAMAAVGHVGLRCPEPVTVGEQVARLSWGSTLALHEPWIKAYFDHITARGCRVEDDEPTVDLKGGA